MNYEKIYYDFINNRKKINRKKLKKNNPEYIYYESHHILPKSLGGKDDKENLVLLTGKEHFIAHKLLIQFTSGKDKLKMISALWYMCRYKKNISARNYEFSKSLFVAIIGKRMRELKLGSKLSKETIKKRTESRRKSDNYRLGYKGKSPSKEAIQKCLETKKKNYIKHYSIHKIETNEEKKIMIDELDFYLKEGWQKGRRKLSEQTKNKIKNKLKGKKPADITIKNSIKASIKPILQFDLEKNFIKEWNSITEASKELKLNGIGACCQGKQKRTGKFTFSYKFPEIHMEKITKQKKTKEQILKNCIPIFQFDLNMNFLKEWQSAKYAGQILNIAPSDITTVCKKKQKTAKGFVFRYKKEFTESL